MVANILNVLKRAVAGDTAAIQTVLKQFQEQSFSVAEQEEIHTYSKQAAKQSHYAIYLRAIFFDYGYVVKQDPEEGFLLHREAASKGNAKSTYEVGRHFLEGFGVDKNYENALQWLKIAAGSPHYVPEAMFDLGRMYEQGWGVIQDVRIAQTWYERAALKGYKG